MTLNLTIVNSAGIWQSSDQRLIDPDTLEVVDEYSIKHVVLQCPDGSALLAYAGVGRVGSVDLSDWIRETLRGERRSLDQSLVLIRELASRDLGPRLQHRGIRHMFSIGAFHQGRPWAIQIRNFLLVEKQFGPVLDRFETLGEEITPPGQGFVFGDPNAVRAGDQEKLMTLATRRPRRSKDFRYLLASLNRRASQTPSGRMTVSPNCVTSYMPPTGAPVESEFHDAKTAPKPLVAPVVSDGIDMTEIVRTMTLRTKGLRDSGKAPDAAEKEEADRAARQAARNAVTPKNRVRS